MQCRRLWFNSWVRKILWRRDRLPTPVLLGLPCGSTGKESACNAGDLGSIPGVGRSPGEGKGYPLQYSGLENSVDCIVNGVAKSWTRLNDFHCTLDIYLFGYAGLSCHIQDQVPWPGIEPVPPPLGGQSLSHWTTREVPILCTETVRHVYTLPLSLWVGGILFALSVLAYTVNIVF